MLIFELIGQLCMWMMDNATYFDSLRVEHIPEQIFAEYNHIIQ